MLQQLPVTVGLSFLSDFRGKAIYRTCIPSPLTGPQQPLLLQVADISAAGLAFLARYLIYSKVQDRTDLSMSKSEISCR